MESPKKCLCKYICNILCSNSNFLSFCCLKELEQELQSMLDRKKVKEKDARYGSVTKKNYNGAVYLIFMNDQLQIQ